VRFISIVSAVIVQPFYGISVILSLFPIII
jgi:hypothetical protein